MPKPKSKSLTVFVVKIHYLKTYGNTKDEDVWVDEEDQFLFKPSAEEWVNMKKCEWESSYSNSIMAPKDEFQFEITTKILS